MERLMHFIKHPRTLQSEDVSRAFPEAYLRNTRTFFLISEEIFQGKFSARIRKYIDGNFTVMSSFQNFESQFLILKKA